VGASILKVSTVDDVDDLSVETRFNLMKVIEILVNLIVSLFIFLLFTLPVPRSLLSCMQCVSVQDYYKLVAKTALGGSGYVKYFKTPWANEVVGGSLVLVS
jgi:hypothetical protein